MKNAQVNLAACQSYILCLYVFGINLQHECAENAIDSCTTLRGYYRCSSSKGCSARKQVERSRTDPNMLVITYTSEHNHPWPTQRNALAGSTRSQPSKPTGSKMGSPSDSQPQKTTKETEMEDMAKQQLDIDEGTTLETQQQQHDQDFFADLDEILFDQQKENKPMDPFTLFDYNNASF